MNLLNIRYETIRTCRWLDYFIGTNYRSRKIQKIKQFSKTQIIEAIEMISYYLSTLYSSFNLHSN